jgi:glycosyltransferase involved in cell wall biosynthesis
MAASLPIVTTRVAAIPENIEDGENGYLVGVDDAEALRSRLEQLAASEDLRLRMGSRSRRIAEERFDMNKNANRLAELLLDLGRRPAKD